MTKFWNVAEDSAEITIYGDILDGKPPEWFAEEFGDSEHVCPQEFRADLEAVKNAENIVVKINSCGGDLYTGLAIHNALKQLDGRKTVIVEGIAASAASVIAMAGDEIQMHTGSLMMIHGVSGLIRDFVTLEDIKKIEKSFEASEKAIANIYSAKTGKDVKDIRKMMTAETWMAGEEAVEAGFADTLLTDDGPKVAASADKKVLLVAGVRHDVSSFHVPDFVAIDKRIQSAKADENKTTDSVKQEDRKMTLEELKESAPELVNEITAGAVSGMDEKIANAVEKAVNAERERISRIDEIAKSINDSDLIHEAKYGESPMTAEQLAFEALKKQQAQGGKFLADMKADTEDSKANDVSTAPNAGVEEAKPANTADETLKKGVEVLKKMKGE